MAHRANKHLQAVAYALATCRPVLPDSPDLLGLPVSPKEYPLARQVWMTTRNHVMRAEKSQNPRLIEDLFIRATEAPKRDRYLHGE